MELSNPDSPFELTEQEKAGVEAFKDYFWHSSETCNNCFQRVRSVGPEKIKQLGESEDRHLRDGKPLSITINEWYQRTENGSQEHTTWDDNPRFGTTFCLNCGFDLSGNHRGKSIQELKPLAKNIAGYTRDHTPLDLDAERFARELVALKKEPQYQKFETEILALSFARAIDHVDMQ